MDKQQVCMSKDRLNKSVIPKGKALQQATRIPFDTMDTTSDDDQGSAEGPVLGALQKNNIGHKILVAA
jgi:hypothetical protein